MQHRAILYERADNTPKPWLFSGKDGHSYWRDVPFRMALADVDAQLQAVIAGLGVAQMPSWLVQNAVDSGELEILLPQQQPEGLPLSVIWPRRKQLLPKVDVLLTTLTQLTIR